MSDQEVDTTEQEVAPKLDDLMAEIEGLKSANERLLRESTKYKTRKEELDAYRAKVDAYEKKELEAKGNYQEMLERERQRIAELQNDLSKKDNMILENNIFRAVSDYATDAISASDLLELKKYSTMIEYDEQTLEPIPETVKKFVDTLREEKKHMFKGNRVASMADDQPAIDKPVEKSLAQMSKEERKKHLGNLLSQMPMHR